MRNWAKLVLVVLALGVLYWPGIQYHWKMGNNPYFVSFDAAHVIPPFFKFDRNDPIPTNFVKEYYLDALSPILYKWLIRIGAELGDVRHFQLGDCAHTLCVDSGPSSPPDGYSNREWNALSHRGNDRRAMPRELAALETLIRPR